MRSLRLGVAVCGVLGFAAASARAQEPEKKTTTTMTSTETEAQRSQAPGSGPADSTTEGMVHVSGQAIAYRAVAGTITVGATDTEDARLTYDGKLLPDQGVELPAKPEDRPAIARIFYAAYFKKATPGEVRPVTFLYNGGPGSATMYLHMGAFGPKRVVTTDAQHDLGAPYRIVENQYSLLDASDLVFIDAPGTGFSRIMGRDAGKAFWGTDQDAHAFDRFIRKFLSKYDRWNSPKFLFGESYGTTRSAVLSNDLQDVDLNGVMLLSQILSFDNSADGSDANPGTEQGYYLALPSFAATAWYHHRVPGQTGDLQALLKDVEQYSLGEYASALLQGADLPDARKQAVAEKLHSYTGIPSAFWIKANLRLTGGEFSKELQDEAGITTGRLDSRYQGPHIDPLSREADYDPFTNAIGAAYAAAINTYSRTELKFGAQMTYKPSAREPGFQWELRHEVPGAGYPEGSVNVMTDLADTMKRNPKMKVLLMGGYFDLGTLYFGATYEMKHLPMPASLQSNISYKFFETGHMVYVNEDALKGLHDTAASFVRAGSGGR